jgi:hypothetical protein
MKELQIKVGDIFQNVGRKDGSIYLVTATQLNQHGEETYEIEYFYTFGKVSKYCKTIYEPSYLRSIISKGSWKHFPVKE